MEARTGVLVVEKVYAGLKNKILIGEFLPGTHLIESDLSAEFKVSRVTIRDALRRLVYDELVDLKPNSGIWVRRLSYQEIVDMYMVREPVEVLAARMAAQQPPERLMELKEICAEGSRAISEMNRIKHKNLNSHFHRALAIVTGNQTLVKILERLKTQMIANQFMPLVRDQDLKNSQIDHEMLVDALMGGNCDEAERIMRSHVQTGRDFALAAFKTSL